MSDRIERARRNYKTSLDINTEISKALEQPWAGVAANDAKFRTVPEAVMLMLDVLRANNLHQGRCQLRQALAAEAGSMVLYPRDVPLPPCDCWLSEEL